MHIRLLRFSGAGGSFMPCLCKRTRNPEVSVKDSQNNNCDLREIGPLSDSDLAFSKVRRDV